MRAEGRVCNRRRENGDIEAPQAVIQLERVKGEEYHIGHMHTHIHYRSVYFFIIMFYAFMFMKPAFFLIKIQIHYNLK